MDTLELVKSRGHARGIEWKKVSVAKDRGFLMMWRQLLTHHLDAVESALELLGETIIDAPEIIQPPDQVARQSQVARSSKSFRWAPASVRMFPSLVRQVPVVLKG